MSKTWLLPSWIKAGGRGKKAAYQQTTRRLEAKPSGDAVEWMAYCSPGITGNSLEKVTFDLDLEG